MDIDTHEVLEAAKTKWNFYLLSQVGWWTLYWVDPYLTPSTKFGYHPEVILAGDV